MWVNIVYFPNDKLAKYKKKLAQLLLTIEFDLPNDYKAAATVSDGILKIGIRSKWLSENFPGEYVPSDHAIEFGHLHGTTEDIERLIKWAIDLSILEAEKIRKVMTNAEG